MRNIRDLSLSELEKFMISAREQKFRARQVFEWLHKHKVSSLSEMKNVSNIVKEKLYGNFECDSPIIEKEYKSKIDDTKKYLIKMTDGCIVESVLMNYKYGFTICISSEVGCNMGCKFCASTIGGMVRNLTAAEMLSQVYLIEKANDINISNIVVMGSGEPLMNFDNLVLFLKLINHPYGHNLSLRNVTISTCGIVPNIKKLADLNLQVTLALSLHAPNDNIRKKIMPTAEKYNLENTMSAMAYYFEKTGRRITFEYSLIKNKNSDEKSAKELVSLIRNSFRNCHVDFNINLIPVNEVAESGLSRPNNYEVNVFKSVLENAGMNVTIRRELGSDISGSCGQLRAKVKK